MFGGSRVANDEGLCSVSTTSSTRGGDDNTVYNKASESMSEGDDDDDGEEEGYSEEEDEEIEDEDEATDDEDEDDDDDEATEDDESDDGQTYDDETHDEEYSASGSFATAKESLWSAGSEVTGNDVDDHKNNPNEISNLKPSNSMSFDSRDLAYGPSYSSHSLASDATEERGHTSRSVSPQKKSRHVDIQYSSRKGRNNDKQMSKESISGLSTNSIHSTNGDNNTPTNQENQYVPRILENKRRVAGGAAAKLIGRRNVDNYIIVDDEDDELEVVAPIDELIKDRDMAKAEFSLGSTENKRYRALNTCESNNDDFTLPKDGDKNLPRVLNRSKIFHENATAAIVSILTPSNKSMVAPDIEEILSTRSDTDIQMTNSNGSSNYLMKSRSRSSAMVHPAKRGDLKAAESEGSDNLNAVEDAIETLSKTGKSPLVQQLLTKKTERRLSSIQIRMKDPNKNLTELMEAIASPKSGLFNRHYMVRRKNACGALKVLTANASHRVNICWTLGVLPTLTSILEDCGPNTLEDVFPDVSIRHEYFEARKRAVSALVNLAIPQDNKLPIFHCPRLVASLILVINQDDEEARRGCCAVLAHLSKSRENRLIMAQVPGLLDAVSGVIEPKENHSRSNTSMSCDSDDERPDIFDQLSKDNFDEENTRGDETEEDPAEASARYDEDPNEFLHSSRQNIFALLSHLLKEKDNAFILARHSYLIDTLVAITRLQESSSQDFGLKLLAYLSRHRSNSKILVFKMKEVVPAVVFATHSENAESRKYACFTLQNFSQDKPCRQQLASVNNLLLAVCCRIRGSKNQEEKLAALYTLKNLTDEPANLIPMTNTPECFATLMQVAHASDDSVTEMMQYLGCDALATLSHWFRSIATSGQRIGTMNQGNENKNKNAKKDELFVPTLQVLNWEPWQ